MKRCCNALILVVPFCVSLSAPSRSAPAGEQAKAIGALAERVLGKRAGEFRFESIPQEDGRDVFEVESRGGQVTVRGSSGAAMAAGLNWFLKYHCKASVSWCGSQLKLPQPLPDAPKFRRATPFRYRYFFNFCSFSYSLAWWHWPQWERFIDWMALNGINMPLAVTGQEAVWQRVCRKLGLDDKGLEAFLVGPAYLPFGWMGCIDAWGGPLPQSWIDGHVALQKQILARQRELGMTPVLQGFTGHVPAGLRARFPKAKFRKLPRWCGFPSTYFLDPADPLFQRVGKMFIEEQTREFGTDHLYASDTFIEMSPPSNDPAFLAQMGKAVYGAMAAADPEAVWVMQGWIFVNNPRFWKPPQGKGLFSAVPDDRLILLDLYCEARPAWKITQAFYGRPWVWCIIHNYGGVVSLYGGLPQIANGLPAALASPERGKLRGLGACNEGIGYNPIVFDLLFEMAWRKEPPDLKTWVRDYARRRYGRAHPQAERAWDLLRRTVYRLPGRTGSIPTARPGLGRGGTWPGSGGVPYDPLQLVRAWEALLASADELGHLDTYRYDLVHVSRQCLVNLASPLHAQMGSAYTDKDLPRFRAASERFFGLVRDLDALLATREEFLLGKWIDDARRWATTDAEKRRYEWNARNQITLWGPRYSVLHEYARKDWAGLLAGFYLPRWQMFVRRLETALEKGTPFDASKFHHDITGWEEAWTHKTEPYPAQPTGDAVAVSRRLFAKYKAMLAEAYKPDALSLTTGKPATCSAVLPPHPVHLANDGRRNDTNKFWACDVATQPKPAWWQVDLQRPTLVGRVVVVGYYGDERYYGFTVETSLDGKRWDLVADRRDNKKLSTRAGYTCRFPPRLVRHIRVTQHHNSANTGRHLVEVMAYEK